MWGSLSVLNTSAVTGAFASAVRVAACFVLRSVPATSARSAGEGSSSAIRSSRAWTPTDFDAVAHTTGMSLPAEIPARSAFSISGSPSDPSSRYFASRSSSVSAAASTSFSRYSLARSESSAGISPSAGLLPASVTAFILTRSTYPLKPDSSPMGRCSATSRPLSLFPRDSKVRKKSARSRSRRLTTTTRGRSNSVANFQTFSVWTWTPATASTTTTAASTTRSPARASAMKSPYPGVSTRLIRWPFQSQ